MGGYQIFAIAMRLICAAVMGGMIGAERANRHQAAGLRTFSLVCLGSALAQIVDVQMVTEFGTGDPVRLAQGVISGIGFLGVGTIIVTKENQIKGLTTAATLWTTAVLGICIGSGCVLESVLAFALVFVIVRLLAYASRHMERYNREIDLVLELDNQEAVKAVLDYVRGKGYRIIQMERSRYPEYVKMQLELELGGKLDHNEIIDELSRMENIGFVQENR